MGKTVCLMIAASLFCILLITPTAAEEPGTEESSEPSGTEPARVAPDLVTINSLEKLYGPVQFSHAMHVEIAGDCADCHHHGEKGQTPPCGACHGKPFDAGKMNMPGLKGAYHLQCMNCHKQMESGPTGCTDCHAKKMKKDSN